MTTTAGVTLIMATVLVVTASAARAGALTAEADGVKVALGREPAEPGTSRKTTYTLRLVEASGTPVTGARVTLSGKMGDGMSIAIPLRATPEPGVYRGEVLFTMKGPGRCACAWQARGGGSSCRSKNR